MLISLGSYNKIFRLYITVDMFPLVNFLNDFDK